LAPARFGEKCVPRTATGKGGNRPEPVKLRPKIFSKSENILVPALDGTRPNGAA
jgi:hypothetical protein